MVVERQPVPLAPREDPVDIQDQFNAEEVESMANQNQEAYEEEGVWAAEAAAEENPDDTPPGH